jgi:hypothetical protein
MFINDAETFVRCQNIFDVENFDQRLRPAAEFITNYIDQYKIMPEPTILQASTGIKFARLDLAKENYDCCSSTNSCGANGYRFGWTASK